MTHTKKRCYFCGNTYYYQGSGEDCLEPTNDDRYCSSCKAIIDKALEEQVPKENILIFYPKEVENFNEELLKKMKELKSSYEEKKRNCSISYFCSLDYDNIEIYYIGRYKYYIAYNEDINDKHYFIEYEYCKTTKEYSKPFEYLGNKLNDSYAIGISSFRIMKEFSKIEFSSSKLDKPNGLDFFEFFDIIEKENKDEVKD